MSILNTPLSYNSYIFKNTDITMNLISHSLQIKRDGQSTRLIPSLDGSLYQFDGENIEPVPFTADTLLSSSFRFTDESTIVGGKDSIKYGIDANTGQVSDVLSRCAQIETIKKDFIIRMTLETVEYKTTCKGVHLGLI